jgi:hypothetical protein
MEMGDVSIFGHSLGNSAVHGFPYMEDRESVCVCVCERERES